MREQGWAAPYTGTWVDVGTPRAYLHANLAVLDGTVDVPIDPWARGERAEGSWVGTDVRVAGSARHSVLGAGRLFRAGVGVGLRGLGHAVPDGAHHRAVIYDDGRILAIISPCRSSA